MGQPSQSPAGQPWDHYMILLPKCRPLWVVILWMDGHQTQMNVQINLLWPCVCVVALGVGTVSYTELVLKVVGNSCALLSVTCNVVWVAIRF